MPHAASAAQTGTPEGPHPCAVKTCTKCAKTKSIDFFGARKAMKDGLRSQCKACDAVDAERLSLERANCPTRAAEHKANRRRYRSDNRESLSQQVRDWHARNPGKSVEYGKARYWRNPEKARAARRAWRAANVEKAKTTVDAWVAENQDRCKALTKAWKKANPDRVSLSGAKRRARSASTPWANDAEILSIFKGAKAAEAVSGVRQSVDHIYPLQGNTVCGLHVEHNLRIVPLSVNAAKRNKLPGFLAHELWDPTGPDSYRETIQ